MSDRMRPVPFKELLKQVLCEYREKGSFFYVPVVPVDGQELKVKLSGGEAEAPIGPAAGPHTQLAQNIVAAYAAGARYFELKTVQVLDGESLKLQKPCIYVEDEAYNTEWSTELTVYEALNEYVKAWYLLKLLAEEFKTGNTEGFVFNMSVGYDLEGIRSEKTDYFIESMKDAADTEIFRECKYFTLGHLDWFDFITARYVEEIDSRISNTVTLSTMHGCLPEEIEDIVIYLLEEKGLNTCLKCNPTLLGAPRVREILNEMGYAYISFDRDIFEHDIAFETAVELIKRLKLTGRKNRLEFGIKLTNTFPVRIRNRELPGETMYMSGAALYPLAIGAAAKLSEALDGEIAISYSGGADEGNIGLIYETGICPITVSTLLLKPGGYKNLTKLNKSLAECLECPDRIIQREKLVKLAEEARKDKNYFKPAGRKRNVFQREYSPYCSKCRNCVDVCPNRANVLYEWGSRKYTLHQDGLCNECGNCACFCILGHVPYKEKFTVYSEKKELLEGGNDGIYLEGQNFFLRWKNTLYTDNLEGPGDLPEEVLDFVNDYKRYYHSFNME